jgi:hypothetical protein
MSISQYIHCECVRLLFNVCNDGIKMEAMLTNANGMLQYRLRLTRSHQCEVESVFDSRGCIAFHNKVGLSFIFLQDRHL